MAVRKVAVTMAARMEISMRAIVVERS
jgi:hypothetical protein